MAVKKRMIFLLAIISPVTMLTKQPAIPPEASSGEINKHHNDIEKPQREDVRKLLEEIDATIKHSCFRACQAGWVEYGSSCYFIDNKLTKKWSVARDICLNLEGDLPIIKSVGENEFIFELAKKQDNVAGLYIFGLWIGLKRKNGGEFYWVDDTPLGQRYQAWVPGEPNKPDIEHCGHMYVQGANQQKWNDIRCDLDSSKDYNNMGMIVLCQKKL